MSMDIIQLGACEHTHTQRGQWKVITSVNGKMQEGWEREK